jgi:hypothetical protein
LEVGSQRRGFMTILKENNRWYTRELKIINQTLIGTLIGKGLPSLVCGDQTRTIHVAYYQII